MCSCVLWWNPSGNEITDCQPRASKPKPHVLQLGRCWACFQLARSGTSTVLEPQGDASCRGHTEQSALRWMGWVQPTQNQAGASSGLDQAPLCLPTARVHCGDPLNVLGIRNSDSILYLRTMQAGFLERGLKAAWPALFSHTSSSTFLNHPIDLKGGFMK